MVIIKIVISSQVCTNRACNEQKCLINRYTSTRVFIRSRRRLVGVIELWPEVRWAVLKGQTRGLILCGVESRKIETKTSTIYKR